MEKKRSITYEKLRTHAVGYDYRESIPEGRVLKSMAVSNHAKVQVKPMGYE